MLIGISLGPGDPGLLTFKAAEALQASEKVFVPGEMAAKLARPYCHPHILEFPMIGDEAALAEIWAKNADIVADHASRGKVAFACIGDVNTFSTFIHLRRMAMQRHPEILVETIPGVGIVPVLASRFGIGLDKSFQISDGSKLHAVIRIKATRPRKMAKELEAQGFGQFILGMRLCTPEETVIQSEQAEDLPERSDYFSVLYARRTK